MISNIKAMRANAIKECLEKHSDVLKALREFQYEVAHADDGIFKDKEERGLLLNFIGAYHFKLADTGSALRNAQTNMKNIEKEHWPELTRFVGLVEKKDTSRLNKLTTFLWQKIKPYQNVIPDMRTTCTEIDMRLVPAKRQNRLGIDTEYDLRTGEPIRGDGWVESRTYIKTYGTARSMTQAEHEDNHALWTETNLSQRLTESKRAVECALTGWREADEKYQAINKVYQKSRVVKFDPSDFDKDVQTELMDMLAKNGYKPFESPKKGSLALVINDLLNQYVLALAEKLNDDNDNDDDDDNDNDNAFADDSRESEMVDLVFEGLRKIWSLVKKEPAILDQPIESNASMIENTTIVGARIAALRAVAVAPAPQNVKLKLK